MYLIKNVRLYTGEETYENGAVITDGARIVYAGEESKMTAPPLTGKDITVIDGGGGICMPGLANTHAHAAMVLLRGAGSGLPLYDWLDVVVPLESRITPDMMYTGVTLAIMEMLKNGITAFADMYFLCEDMLRAIMDAGIRANVTRGSTDPEGVAYHEDLYKKYNDINGRIRIYTGLHAEYTSDENTVRLAAEMAKKLGTGIHIHCSETEKEVRECIERHGKTPTEYFNDLGIFDVPTIAAHCVHLTESDTEIFSDKNVTAVNCPASNLYLCSGIAPVNRLLEHGINVAIGTDGAASNNTLDMFREMRLSALLAKYKANTASALAAEEVIKMATVNGFSAMGFENTGVIREGFNADLVILDGGALHLNGIGSVASDIVYSASGSDVKLTMVCGEILYRNGEYTTIDAEKMKYERAAAEQILRA